MAQIRIADDQPAVLAGLVDVFVARPGQEDVLVDAGHLVGAPQAVEEVVVGLGLPDAVAGTGAGAAGAALLSVGAVVGTELVLEVERPVAPRLVVVTDHVVGTGDDTSRAPRAEVGVDDLGLQFLPLRQPSRGLDLLEFLGERHKANLPAPARPA